MSLDSDCSADTACATAQGGIAAIAPPVSRRADPKHALQARPLDLAERLRAAQALAGRDIEEAIAQARQCLAIAHDFKPARDLLHKLLRQVRPDALEFAQINIEVTNKCSNHCYFCPRDQLTRQQGVMSQEDFVFAIDRINEGTGEYVRRVDLQSFGESVLDKGLPDKLRHLRRVWPAAYMTLFSTLAMPLKEDYLLKLLASGLDELVVSLYAITPEDYQAIYGYKGFENMMASLSLLAQYNQLLGSPVRLVAKLPHERMYLEKGLTRWRDKCAAIVEACEPHGLTFVDSPFSNFGGGREYNAPADEVCPMVQAAKRWMVVAWNLDVTPCCWDFNSTMVFGNLRRDSLRGIIESPRYREFVRAHVTGRLDAFPTCAKCDTKFDLE